MNLRRLGGLFCIALGGAAFAPVAGAASPTCTGSEQLVSWPVGAPVWEFCYTAYAQSSGPRGSGLDLRKVYYNGHLLLKQMHAPMLFAEYGEGPSQGTCYRDWKDDPASIMAEPQVRNTIGTSVNFNATTSCDRSNAPSTSYGTCPFQIAGRSTTDCFTNGVALENKGDHLLITAQYDAAWYQYTSRVAFYLDGSFEPEFGFGNSDGTNNNTTHWHHNYWRLDFDIDGPADDQILENAVVQTSEFGTKRCNSTTTPSCATERRWSVRDTVTGRGYELVPSADDYVTPTNESGNAYHLVDFMATAYVAGQYGDVSTNNLSDCSMDEENLVGVPGSPTNPPASLVGTDVVMWYRVGVRDVRVGSTTPPTDVMICKKAGPGFRPIGDWGGPALYLNGFED